MKNPTPEVIEHFLDFLVAKKSDSSFESYISIKNAINEFSIPYPAVSVPKGKLLFRSRLHLNNEEFFSSIHDLGHIKSIDKIKDFGRANEPNQSIFYCTDNRYVASFETSRITRENIDCDFEVMTTGVWQVQEDLRVGQIVSNNTIHGLNKTMDGLQTSFLELVDKFKNEHTKHNLDVLNLFSQEFTRDAKGDKRNYFISCAFANYIYDQYGYDTHLKAQSNPAGVLYPSVIYRAAGMNIAIKPEIINKEKIKLVGAVRTTMTKTGENEFSDTDKIETKNINYQTSEIGW